VIRAKVQGTFIGRYCIAGGQLYCNLNGVCYSDHYVKGTYSRLTVVLGLDWSVLE